MFLWDVLELFRHLVFDICSSSNTLIERASRDTLRSNISNLEVTDRVQSPAFRRNSERSRLKALL
jgi:hypothetical protein